MYYDEQCILFDRVTLKWNDARWRNRQNSTHFYTTKTMIANIPYKYNRREIWNKLCNQRRRRRRRRGRMEERRGEGKQQKCIGEGEWLDLKVGRKMFSCKFCNREFHATQALCGHQNAHKREKSMLQHCMAAAVRQHRGGSALQQLPMDRPDALDLDLKL